jgi:ATP-binding cassette subfamily B protein
MENIVVRAAGHTILEDISLMIAAGEHVAIVGPSGAGKSSLVGLLLGWHRPAAGHLLVDGEPFDGARLARLRRKTAWVDPAIQLWNRSLLDNLRYSAPDADAKALSCNIEQANLRQLLEQLPNGLQTALGEDGALVSGGEGQRVRLGRALMRPDARLVILDEPFRGLSRDQRHELLVRARRLWQDATFLCITHDISETQLFERILVVEDGRIVEDAAPCELLAQPDSRYRAMREAETEVCGELWSETSWHRLQLVAGHLIDMDRVQRDR